MDSEKVRVEIAKRFVEGIDQLIAAKKVKNYVEVAKFLELGKSSISDMKYGRSGVDLVHLYSMIKSYPDLNLNYIVTGQTKKESSNFEDSKEFGLMTMTLGRANLRIAELEEEIDLLKRQG